MAHGRAGRRRANRWTWGGAAALALVAAARPAAAGDPLLFDTSPPATSPATATATAPAPEPTPSQANTHQFNQLFEFETTPNICAAGEGYISGQATYLNNLPGAGGQDFYGNQLKGQEARFQVQGQYGVTDQLAVGALVPVVYRPDGFGTSNDVDTGDVAIYGQYKLDQLIRPSVVDVTVQLDLVLPTGHRDPLGDGGRIGARPAVLAYKDFGQVGPGVLGAYGFVAYTARRHPDGRAGLAATYEFPNGVAAVAELSEVTGSYDFDDVGLFTPGVLYRGLRPFEFALGVPLGLSRGAPDVGVTFKLTYAFARD